MRKAPRNTPLRTALTPYSIGMKLKTLRTEKGLTLTRLGAEVGLSSGLLSKLESEHMIPTIPTLLRICHVHGIDLTYFFAVPTQHSLAITRHSHMMDGRREQPSIRQTPLHATTAQGHQLAKIVEISVGATLRVSEVGARTELTAYVLEGTLHVTAAGAEEILHTGDCIVLDTDTPVVWSAPETRSRVLAVFAK